VAEQNLIPADRIEKSILLLRRQKVILDAELASLYKVDVKVLNQAVKRNIARFPSDFMFQLNEAETKYLRSQIVTLKNGRGRHRKYLPYAFTEQGVAMLSSVLRSPRLQYSRHRRENQPARVRACPWLYPGCASVPGPFKPGLQPYSSPKTNRLTFPSSVVLLYHVVR
jgi:hypothetical protein